MSDNRKYYYMKLKDNFFDSDSMVVLESMRDGYIYSNILMKLYLRSLQHNGRLMLNGRIPYNSTTLASVTRHSVGDIEKAVKAFEELGLVEILDNGAIYMLDIQNFIGKSSTEGDRKRLYRKTIEAEKTQGQIPGQMSGQMSDKRPPEIEKEIEKEIDIEKEIKKEPTASLLEDYSDEFIQAFNDFREMRKQIKAKMTPRAEEMILKKLHSLSESEHEQIEILNQSTMNAWKGVFPLKDKKDKGESTGYEPDYEHGIVL